MTGIWVTRSPRSYLHGKAQTSDNEETNPARVISHASEETFKPSSERENSISRRSTRSSNIAELRGLQRGKLKQTRPAVFTLQHETGSVAEDRSSRAGVLFFLVLFLMVASGDTFSCDAWKRKITFTAIHSTETAG